MQRPMSIGSNSARGPPPVAEASCGHEGISMCLVKGGSLTILGDSRQKSKGRACLGSRDNVTAHVRSSAMCVPALRCFRSACNTYAPENFFGASYAAWLSSVRSSMVLNASLSAGFRAAAS